MRARQQNVNCARKRFPAANANFSRSIPTPNSPDQSFRATPARDFFCAIIARASYDERTAKKQKDGGSSAPRNAARTPHTTTSLSATSHLRPHSRRTPCGKSICRACGRKRKENRANKTKAARKKFYFPFIGLKSSSRIWSAEKWVISG